MITVNMDKAKLIGHEIRRANRAEEFKPLDDALAKRMPGVFFETVDAERQVIRDKYAVIQTKVDAATTTDEIKAALGI